jgi:hypothetical protein
MTSAYRERVLAVPCPRHGPKCKAVGIAMNRHVTWTCGHWSHVDDQRLAPPKDRE